ncbi:MAG: ELWxxDGT repeat protein, partial [Candidatus Poseidoniales archaeon]
MFSKRIISMLVVLSFISQALVVVDTDSYSSVVVEDSSILEELSEQDGARASPSNLSVPFTDFAGGTGSCSCMGGTTFTNGKIMIFAADSDNTTYGGYDKDFQLYVTDGTLTGTSMIKEINEGGIPVSQFNSGISHTWHNDVLYFALDDGIHGKEFWRTDGTEEGTYLVKDIREGEVGSEPSGFVVWKNHIYFKAMDSTTTGYELWKSDGSEDGTAMLKDIYPGDNWDESSNPGGFKEFKGKLYFSAEDEDHGRELWTTDGTEEGTVLFMDIDSREGSTGFEYSSSPSNFLIFNDFMYFSASNASGKELWKTDGTIEGTVLVKDIVPGTTGSGIRGIVASNLATSRSGYGKFAVMDDHFYFQVKTCSSEDCFNLWKSDGTEEGTVAVTSFEEGDDIQIYATYRGGYVVGESKIVFVVEHHEYDEELWITDGTPEGTHLVKDINVDDDGDGGNDGDSQITRIVAGSGDIFYFSANPGVVNEDALWRTDGTENGTYEVGSLPIKGISLSGVGHSNSGMTPFGNHLIFSGFVSSAGGACAVGCGEDFWILHNISSGFSPTPSYTVYTNDEMDPITFEVPNLQVSYNGNGTAWMVKDVKPGSSSGHPHDLTAVGNMLFFSAFLGDNTDNEELWKSDGTASGTVLVKDINSGSDSSSPEGLIAVGNTLYFTADDGTNGR